MRNFGRSIGSKGWTVDGPRNFLAAGGFRPASCCDSCVALTGCATVATNRGRSLAARGSTSPGYIEQPTWNWR